MQFRPRRWPLATVCAGLLMLQGMAWGAPTKPPIEVENFRVGFSNNSQNNLYKIGTWTPVWVQLRAGTERFSGTMELTVPDDDGTTTLVQQTIDLAPNESRRLTAYVRPGTLDHDFGIRLIDPSRRLRTPRITGTSLAKFEGIPMRGDESLVLTLGNPQGVEMIPTLPGFNTDKNSPGQITVARIDVTGGYLPGRWFGYDAARAIVLDTNDREVMSSLDTLRGRAIADWVQRGGHLVVAVGSNWQQVRDSVIGPLLPAIPAGQERVTDLGSLETFTAGATKPITPPGSPPVMIAKLEGIEARGGKILSTALGAPLVVRGAHGFGRVTLIALDVDQRPFAKWDDRPLFWVRALDLRRQGNETSTDSVGAAPRRIYRAGSSDLASVLRQSLEQFQGVKLISFGWVAFFIFLYILLIGPGDYLFLKKVLKRMELTWITFPVIVISVSLLAYYAAYVIKGNVLRVNKVDIIDVVQGPGPDNVVPAAGLVRGSTFFDVFSPQNRDYTISVVPLPVERELPKEGGPAPKLPAGTELMLSWFGVPESGFGGMGGGQMSFSSGGYEYQPPGSAETLADVRVPIWSTKCLSARWFGPGPSTPLIDADLKPAGPDRLEGTVTNRSGITLHDTLLAFNKEVYILGKVDPGATIRVELSQERQLSGHLRSKAQNSAALQPWNSERPTINRADLLLDLMFHDSGTTSTTENALSSNPLHDLDLTGLLSLDRPMLIARIERPASKLVLENAASAPSVDQTTLLRVLLPLKKGSDESKP